MMFNSTRWVMYIWWHYISTWIMVATNSSFIVPEFYEHPKINKLTLTHLGWNKNYNKTTNIDYYYFLPSNIAVNSYV